MSDGATPEAATANGKQAVADWIKVMRSAGREIPVPGEPESLGRREGRRRTK